MIIHTDGHSYRCDAAGLRNFKMENARDLEIGAIDQNQIAADHDMPKVRRRRRENLLQVHGDGLYLLLQARGQSPVHHELPLQTRRQTIPFRQSRGETRSVIPIPAVNPVAVIVGTAVAIMTAAVTFSIAMSMPTIIVVGAVIPVVTVAVALSEGDGR